MDPFAVIGLAGNIIAFIDFGFKVIKAAREIRESASGITTENEHVKSLATQIEALTFALQSDKPASKLTADEQCLDKLAKECQCLSHDLLKLLQTFQVQHPNKKSKREALGAVLRSLRKKDERDDLVARLERCKQQLHIQLSRMSSLETQARLTYIINAGKCHESELQQLTQHVEILRDAVQSTSLGQSLSTDIRRLLSLADEAIDKVLQNTVIEVLRQDKMDERYDTVESAYENTFNWLFDDYYQPSHERLGSQDVNHHRQAARNTFVDWLSSGNDIFHISGKPGAGKSTLMKYVCESDHTLELLNHWAGTKKLVFAKFFFWRYGTEVQKSWNGLLRSLLFSIISECPALIQSIFPTQWQSVKDSKPCRLSAVDIQRAFIGLLKRKDIFEHHKFAFFIDGLDEFVGRDDELISSLFSWTYNRPTDLKICVSSRELPIFQQRFSKCSKLRLHELTEPDMYIFVQDTLNNNEDFKDMPERSKTEILYIGDSLVKNAEGVFLWLSLALRSLEDGILLEDSIFDLKKKIDSLPREVEELFGAIFETIRKNLHPLDRDRALRTLGFVVASTDANISVPQLQASFLDDYGDDENFAENMSEHVEVHKVQSRLRRCQKQIEGRCRGLLSIVGASYRFNIRQGYVVFTHRSLVEYFQKPDVIAYVRPYSDLVEAARFKHQASIAELKCAAAYLSKNKHVRTDKTEKRTELPQTNEEVNNELVSAENGTKAIYDEHRELIIDLCLMLYIAGLESPCTMKMLQPLTLLAEKHLDPPSFPAIEFHSHYYDYKNPRQWKANLGRTIYCRASFFGILSAASLGMYDLSRTTGHDLKFLERQLAEDASTLHLLVQHHIAKVANGKVGHTREVLRALLGCLELGVSPQDPAHQHQTQLSPTASFWEVAAWSFLTEACTLLPQPFLLAFIIYGADTLFWLDFEISEGNQPIDKLVFVRCQFGSEKKEPFLPLSIDPDEAENIHLLELAEKNAWKLSFHQILQFWCPSDLHKFDKLAELRAGCGNEIPGADEIKEMKEQCGLDIENWNEAEWTIPSRLLTPLLTPMDDQDCYDSETRSLSSDVDDYMRISLS